MVTIKAIETASVKDLARIHVASWREGYKGFVPQSYLDGLSEDDYAKKWESWLAEVIPGFVAEVNGEKVGFVSCGKIRTRPAGDKGIVPLYANEVYALYVHPGYWSKGVGRALMGAAVDRLIEEKQKSLLLWVVKKNTRALNFYERLGGQRVGKKKEDIGGRMLDESAIGWRNILQLKAALGHSEGA